MKTKGSTNNIKNSKLNKFNIMNTSANGSTQL